MPRPGWRNGEARRETTERKRESEVTITRKDLEEANFQRDAIITSLKRKQPDASAEVSEQIDQLGKMKAKYEKFLINHWHIFIFSFSGLRRINPK